MSRRWKITIAVLLLLPILAFATGTAVIYRMLGWDYATRFVIGTVMGMRARPLTNRQFDRTPTRVERGRYLVEAARCFTCHSETDSQTDLPLPGAMGAGTVRQLLTKTTYPNLTPDWETGAGSWTDDMLARAIREGVGHDGRALIPIMPYASFKYISDDDLACMVVYLRSIPPVHHALPEMKLPLLFKLTAAGFPDDLKELSVKVELKQEDIDGLVEHLIGSGDLQKSLARIAVYFIPKADQAQQVLAKIKADAPLVSLFPITIFEKDGRATAKIGSIDDDAEGRLYKQLGETVGFYQPFLVLFMEKIRERYAPSVEDILGFLYQSPLFTESRHELLEDGLRAYERQDFVKAIHVLVPQVEQSLRNLLSLLRIPTTKTVARHPGIEDVKSMNDVLSDERARSALTENLWRYLSVVYIERKGGLNLRNDLAHGLVDPKSFNRGIADRVFHTLLALSLMRPSK